MRLAMLLGSGDSVSRVASILVGVSRNYTYHIWVLNIQKRVLR